MVRCSTQEYGLLLELEPNEADLLRHLGKELRRLLEDAKNHGQKLTAFSPTRQRERDEHSVTGDLEASMEEELMFHRLRRIEAVQEELLPDSVEGKRLDILLDETRSDVWLAYLADVRLLLAEVIGITPQNPDPFLDQDPEAWTMEMQMYHFLSVLQEWILDALAAE